MAVAERRSHMPFVATSHLVNKTFVSLDLKCISPVIWRSDLDFKKKLVEIIYFAMLYQLLHGCGNVTVSSNEIHVSSLKLKYEYRIVM